MAQERRKEREKRTFKNGLFYNEAGFVIAASPYGLFNNRYSTSNNHEAIRDIKISQR